MNLPPVVYAEAGVKSDRAGYTSLFQPGTEITLDNLKKFRADAAKVREAVKLLKEQGFSVQSIGKFSVGIAASPKVFEAVFNVVLVMETDANGNNPSVTVDGSTRKGFIPTDMGIFSDTLTGIAFSQDRQRVLMLQEAPEPPDKKEDWYLYPTDIPQKLGDTEDKRPKANKIRVAIIDTGAYYHSYFNKKGIKEEQIKIEKIQALKDDYNKANRIDRQVRASLKVAKDIVDELDKIGKKKSRTKMRNAFKTKSIKKTTEDLMELEELSRIDFSNLKNILEKDVELISTRKELKNHFGEISESIQKKMIVRLNNALEHTEKEKNEFQRVMDEPDPDGHGHGTMVVSNLLAVAPQAEAVMIKMRNINPSEQESFHVAGSIQPYFAAALALDPKPNIISCSYGSMHSEDELAGKLNEEYYMNYKANFLKAINDGIVVLFAAGNYSVQNNTIPLSLEAQWVNDGAIVVGGAFYNKKNKLTASNMAQGYKRRVDSTNYQIPDVCGLVGPQKLETQTNTEYQYYPKPPHKKSSDQEEETWGLSSGGTSAATPQIAGVCALILTVFPNATPKEVKHILKETATKVKNGKSAQNNQGNVATGKGLVNIPKALQMARKMHAEYCAIM